MSDRVALCAPGNRFGAALALCFQGEEVDEIRESRFVEDDRVWIVNESELALWGEWKFPVIEKPWPLVECPGCGMPDVEGKFTASMHSSWCWVTHPSFPSLAQLPWGGLISGI